MASHYQLGGTSRKGVKEIKILFAGNSEDVLDPFVFKCLHKQIGCFHAKWLRDSISFGIHQFKDKPVAESFAFTLAFRSPFFSYEMTTWSA